MKLITNAVPSHLDCDVEANNLSPWVVQLESTVMLNLLACEWGGAVLNMIQT